MYKVLIIGDSAVGKTSLLKIHIDQCFSDSEAGTIGVDFKKNTYQVGDYDVGLQLWDTAGQERFRALSQPYYRNADAVVVVFDLNNENSFEHIPFWLNHVEKYCSKDCLIILVGNKCDLPYRVSRIQVNQLVGTTRVNQYLEASAKKNTGISVLFYTIAEQLHYQNSRMVSTVGNSKGMTLTHASNIELSGTNTESNCCK